jgi:MFS family permease
MSEVPPRRLLPILLAGSSVGVLAFGAASWLWLFTTLRIVQSLCLAPLFPVIIARMMRLGGGETIGILNAARAGGNFLGPVVATTVLAWAPPGAVYALLGLGGLAAVPLTRQ